MPSELEYVDVPEEYKAIGFTGLFWREIGLDPSVDIDEFEARLPARIPFGTNSSQLALKVVRHEHSAAVVVVWTDAAAIVEIATIPPVPLRSTDV